jgi:propionate CoA-transferase
MTKVGSGEEAVSVVRNGNAVASVGVIGWITNPGAGGFIDIACNARELVFTGTFTTGGLEVALEDGALRIVKEGKVRNFVRTADHVTYPMRKNVAGRGQRATIVTERAVFEVRRSARWSIAERREARRDAVGRNARGALQQRL